MGSWSGILHTSVILNNLFALAILITLTGASLSFLGYIESLELREKAPNWIALLLSCLMSGAAFALVIGLGFRRDAYHSALGASIGVGLGAAYWSLSVLGAINARIANGPHRFRRRIRLFLFFIAFYFVPLLFALFSFLVIVIPLLIFAILISLVDENLLSLVPSAVFTFIFGLTVPYIAGTVLSFSGKAIISHAFEPNMTAWDAIAALFLFGWVGGSGFFITMHGLRLQRKPTNLKNAISTLEFWRKVLGWWSGANRWLTRRIEKRIKKLEDIHARHAHEVYLQYASLMAGMGTGLGFGSISGLVGGPALGLKHRIVFGVEVTIAPLIFGFAIQSTAGKRMALRLTVFGIYVFLFGTLALLLEYLIPLP